MALTDSGAHLSHPTVAELAPFVMVGPMASGKSTVGRVLATKLGLDLLDSDALIVERAGRSIAEIFAADGEPEFRELEHHIIAETLASFRGVFALGGGAVMDARTRALLRHHTCVYLTIDERAAGYRLRGDTTRPMIAEGGMAAWRNLYAERAPLYEEIATVTVDTSRGTLSASAHRIMEALGLEKTL